MFQSLSGLSLGLNFHPSERNGNNAAVSIPFRAVTGFELPSGADCGERLGQVSIPFRAVTGFELIRGTSTSLDTVSVSIPFRAVTGFEPLGRGLPFRNGEESFNPFQGCHWV